MQRTWPWLMAALLWMAAATRAAETAAPETLIWCGLDYSKVKMIGTADFRQPEQIFPGMLSTWNELFIREMLPKLEAMAKSVRTDLDAVTTAAVVKHYKLKNDKGLGLVFVMDRLVKAQEVGCLYVVFFDVDSRKVLRSERLCEKAGGFGFRNYWFRPVKGAVDHLPPIYKQVKAGSQPAKKSKS